jgi:hypothetical protein
VIHAPAAAAAPVKLFVVLISCWVNGNKLAPSSRAAEVHAQLGSRQEESSEFGIGDQLHEAVVHN